MLKKLIHCGCSAVTVTNAQTQQVGKLTTYKSLVSRFSSAPSDGQPEDKDLQCEPFTDSCETKMPKIPLKPFVRFASKYRSIFLAKYPGIDVIELQKRLAMVWNDMSTENRAEYFDSYAKDSKNYFTDLSEFKTYMNVEYQKSLDQKVKKAANKTEVTRRKLLKKYFKMPKKVGNAYLLFCAEKLKERRESFSSRDESGKFLRGLSQTWRAMSEKEKSKYREQYSRELLIYESLMVDWEREVVEAGYSFLLPERKRFDFQPTNIRHRRKSRLENNRLAKTPLEERDHDQE